MKNYTSLVEVLENGVLTCVPHCLRSLVPWERCVLEGLIRNEELGFCLWAQQAKFDCTRDKNYHFSQTEKWFSVVN